MDQLTLKLRIINYMHSEKLNNNSKLIKIQFEI